MKSINKANVSVIVPCYNNHLTIKRAIDSVAAQELLPHELIIVDDASHNKKTHLELDIIKKKYSYLFEVNIFKLRKNQGVAYARNYGWALAKNSYIAFLDSDDTWHPKKLKIQYAFMKKNPEIVISGHAHISNFSQQNKLDWNLDGCQVFFIPKWKLILSNQFITPSVMVKKEITERFDSKQRHMEDHKLWVDIAYKHNPIAKLSAPLASIYKPAFGKSGLSGDLWKMEKADLSNLNYFKMRGYINQFQYLFLFLFSLIRFLRRIVITFFRFF